MPFIGLISGIAIMAFAVALGGKAHLFFNIQGFLVVLGGTAAATLITVSREDIRNASQALRIAFTRKEVDLGASVGEVMRANQAYRLRGRVGLTGLNTENELLGRSCEMVAEGMPVDSIDRVMQSEIDHLMARHARTQAIFRRMATLAPSFGMIGTVIGLVQMLSTLSSPSDMGPAMSLALLTTLYGALLGFMLLVPVTARLKSVTATEIVQMNLIREGIISTLQDANPIHLEEQLRVYLPLGQRSEVPASLLVQDEPPLDGHPEG